MDSSGFLRMRHQLQLLARILDTSASHFQGHTRGQKWSKPWRGLFHLWALVSQTILLYLHMFKIIFFKSVFFFSILQLLERLNVSSKAIKSANETIRSRCQTLSTLTWESSCSINWLTAGKRWSVWFTCPEAKLLRTRFYRKAKVAERYLPW